MKKTTSSLPGKGFQKVVQFGTASFRRPGHAWDSPWPSGFRVLGLRVCVCRSRGALVSGLHSRNSQFLA